MKSAGSRRGLRTALSLLGLAAAAALVWTVGPLVALAGVVPLAGEPARWAAIAALVAGAFAWRLWRAHRAARRNRQLLDGLVAGATAARSASSAAPGSAEVALLAQRFEQAIATLRRAPLGGRRRAWLGALGGRPFVDQLPWYLLIGAPGAGKTTALVNSGLEFPLAKALGGAPVVQGVGGTRNCDWWFTSEAVLIDTAGRYTTHDSDRAADRAAWFGFLDLLLRHRPRRPINGVLLTLSVSDLLGATAARRRAHAGELCERLEELHAKLGIAFPVYVLVTKADLLAGFVEFFADFDKDERAQVWGVTFPYQHQTTRDGPAMRLAADFAALEKRLNDCLLERLAGEDDRARRASIYAFPQQWRVLREALYELLAALLAELAAPLKPCVRGVYFTSATQEGTPMDRALGGMVRALGLAGRQIAPSRPSGKTFFVTNLLREVVFAESGLAGTNLRWRRQRALLQGGAVAAGACGIAAAGALSWQAAGATSQRVATLDAQLPGVEREIAAAAKSGAATDLTALLPALDALASLSPPASAGDASPPTLQRVARRAGLDRGEMLAAAAGGAYERALREAFLPRIAARLEQRLAAGEREHVELIYDTLKAYLMLFAGRRFDRDALRGALLADWQTTLPATTSAEQHAALRRHLDALLEGGEVGAPSAADAALVARSRALVASVPLAERAYQRIKQLALADGTAPLSAESAARALTPTAAGAPLAPPGTVAGHEAARRVFARASGRALADGVPALYTRAVFERSLAERTRDVLAQFERERAWVLGAGAPAATDGDAQAVAPQVQQLYLADYARRWDDYLGDLRLAAAPTLAASAEQAALLARAESPLTALLRAAANELSIAQLAGARFGALPRWIAAPPGPDALQATFGAVAAHLTAVDDAAKRQALPPGSDVLRDLAQAAAQAPEPLRGWLAAFAAHAGKQAFAALREPLARQVAAEIAPQCARLVGTQYPLQRNGVEELSRDAFVRTFAAGGLLDAYFQRQLAPHVDTTTRPWTFRAGGGASEALAAFQRAQAIRDAFFRDGGRAFSVRMEMKLVELDPGVGEFVLDVDGSQPLRFKRGTTHTLAWPGANDGTRVQLQLVAANGTAGTPYAFQGPWALFKLLDRVRSEPGPASDRLRLVFDVEGRKARFEVRTSGALNPIARQDLEQFQCPKGL